MSPMEEWMVFVMKVAHMRRLQGHVKHPNFAHMRNVLSALEKEVDELVRHHMSGPIPTPEVPPVVPELELPQVPPLILDVPQLVGQVPEVPTVSGLDAPAIAGPTSTSEASGRDGGRRRRGRNETNPE